MDVAAGCLSYSPRHMWYADNDDVIAGLRFSLLIRSERYVARPNITRPHLAVYKRMLSQNCRNTQTIWK